MLNNLHEEETWTNKEIDLKDFTFSQERIDERFGLIFLMKSKVTVRTILVKERNVPVASTQYSEIYNRSKLTSNYLLKVFGIKKDIGSNTIQIYFEEIPIDLQSEIQRHLLERTRFSEAELYAILYSCVSALSTLEQHNAAHDFMVPLNIFKFKKDVYKIHDNFTISNRTYLYNHALRGQYLRYVPPEFLLSLARKNEKPDSYNSYKADIYSLAICILDAGLLNTEGDFINKKLMILDENLLKERLKKFASLYSETLAKILEDMLNQDPSKRPSPSMLFNRLPGRPLPQVSGQNSGKKRKLLDKIMNDGSPEKRDFVRSDLFGGYGTPGRYGLDESKERGTGYSNSRDYIFADRDQNLAVQRYKKAASPDKSSIRPSAITEADISRVNVSTSIKNDPILSQFVKKLADPHEKRNSQLTIEGTHLSKPFTPQYTSQRQTSYEVNEKILYPQNGDQEGMKNAFNENPLNATKKNSYPQDFAKENLSKFQTYPNQETLKTYHLESFREQSKSNEGPTTGQYISPNKNLQTYNPIESRQGTLSEYERQDDDRVQRKMDQMIAKALERSSTNLYLSQKVSAQISSTLTSPGTGKKDLVNKLQSQKTTPFEITNEKDHGNITSLFNPKIVESSRVRDSPVNIVDYSQKGQGTSLGRYGEEITTPGFK